MTKKIIIIAVTSLVLIIATLSYVFYQHQHKYVISYSDGSYQYSCTKSLKAKKQNITFEGGVSKVYVPINKTEASQYCKISGAY